MQEYYFQFFCYGVRNPKEIPITEACLKGHCTNPYGQTKSMLEEILIDMHTADVKVLEELQRAGVNGKAYVAADVPAKLDRTVQRPRRRRFSHGTWCCCGTLILSGPMSLA